LRRFVQAHRLELVSHCRYRNLLTYQKVLVLELVIPEFAITRFIMNLNLKVKYLEQEVKGYEIKQEIISKQHNELQERCGNTEQEAKYYDAKYEALSNRYNDLQQMYGNLEQELKGCEAKYDFLSDRYKGLQERHEKLESKYHSLQQDPVSKFSARIEPRLKNQTPMKRSTTFNRAAYTFVRRRVLRPLQDFRTAIFARAPKPTGIEEVMVNVIQERTGASEQQIDEDGKERVEEHRHTAFLRSQKEHIRGVHAAPSDWTYAAAYAEIINPLPKAGKNRNRHFRVYRGAVFGPLAPISLPFVRPNDDDDVFGESEAIQSLQNHVVRPTQITLFPTLPISQIQASDDVLSTPCPTRPPPPPPAAV
jgi:hypothetical protein